MGKAKSKAQVTVADGAGGMMPIVDRRFDRVDWPISFQMPKEKADSWFSHLRAECAKRGWSSGGIGQIEARENSGSLTVNPGSAGQAQLAIVWERKRNGPLKVCARSVGATEFSPEELGKLFDEVNRRCLEGLTERHYRRGQLQYDGLAWRGELWLDDTLRLGPPSVQYEEALFGPRIILVDALIDCAGPPDAASVFTRKLGDVAAFLSVVLGTRVKLPEVGQTWTFSQGLADSAVRSLGYFEPNHPQAMPSRGTAAAVSLRPVCRPDFSHGGIDGSTNELALPADIVDLWRQFTGLEDDRRRDFLQAAAKWQEALENWGKARTLSFALMVVACEALKPPEPRYKEHGIYAITEVLLGKATADRLKEEWFRPQGVRNAHLHRGEFRASELVHDMVMSSYHDPTFDRAHRELALITKAGIIEWLRRGGNFTMPPVIARKWRWRRYKGYAFAVLIGIVLGSALNWLLPLLVR